MSPNMTEHQQHEQQQHQKQQEQEQCPTTQGMLELDDLSHTTNGTNPSNDLYGGDEGHGGDESSIDEDDTDGTSYSMHPLSNSLARSTNPTNPHPPRERHLTYFLGHTFDTTDLTNNTNDTNRIQCSMSRFQKELYWFTYRNDLVVPLRPYGYAGGSKNLWTGGMVGSSSATSATNAASAVNGTANAAVTSNGTSNVTANGTANGISGAMEETGSGMKSDAGWGCMLRSAQMLMAQAVRRHFTYRYNETLRRKRERRKNGINDSNTSNNSNTSNASSTSIGSTNDADAVNTTNASNTPNAGNATNGNPPMIHEDPWEVERIARWFADFPNFIDLHHDLEEDSLDVDVSDLDEDDGETFDDAYNDESALYTDDFDNDKKPHKSHTSHTPQKSRYGDGGLPQHWYSLHQMVAAGLGLGVLPGEWYGPTTACHVLRELNEIHCGRREGLAGRLNERMDGRENGRGEKREDTKDTHDTRVKCDMFRVHIATEGCIYMDAIHKLMTKSSPDKAAEAVKGETTVKSAENDEKDEGDTSNTNSGVIDHPLALPGGMEDPLQVQQHNQHNKKHNTRPRKHTLAKAPPRPPCYQPDPSIPPPGPHPFDLHNLYNTHSHPINNATNSSNSTNSTNNSNSTGSGIEWDTSLLLLLPLRLGLQSIPTHTYGSTLAKLLSFPQSVGMLGGTPRHALWFYGAEDVLEEGEVGDVGGGGGDEKGENGEKGKGEKAKGERVLGWHGLDPHTVQPAPRGTRTLVHPTNTPTTTNSQTTPDTPNTPNTHTVSSTPTYQWQVQLTETYLRSLHTSPNGKSDKLFQTHSNHSKPIPLSKLDPSLALGFYFESYSDFQYFRRLLEGLKEWNEMHCGGGGGGGGKEGGGGRGKKVPEIVTIMERTPNYEVDVSLAMKGMMGKSGNGGGGGNGGKDVDMRGIEELDGMSMKSDEDGLAENHDDFGILSEQEEEEDDDDDDFVLI